MLGYALRSTRCFSRAYADFYLGVGGPGEWCIFESASSEGEFLFCLRVSLSEQCQSHGNFSYPRIRLSLEFISDLALLQILTNVCLLAVGFLLFWLQRLLYGPLRPIETEQLYEKAWFAVTETCLAMTIFRGELGAWFLVMFVSLLVGKVWGWIGEGRVEFLEQQPPADEVCGAHCDRLAALVLTGCLRPRRCGGHRGGGCGGPSACGGGGGGGGGQRVNRNRRRANR